jgi:hypothetical protein
MTSVAMKKVFGVSDMFDNPDTVEPKSISGRDQIIFPAFLIQR